ncbi:MAG: acyltransferase [Burkholderiales bacterium]|nr:acyltransferase [Burkholderiales bacterium]
MRNLWRWIWTQSYWRARLASVGGRSILFRPMLVIGARHIHLGDRTSIREGARLEVIPRARTDWKPRLQVGSGVNIEQGVHIVCQCEVTIGDEVSITPYCVIVDTHHPIDDPDRPPKIGARLPTGPSFVRIGEGSFIGAHSVILPNVTIGRGCVVGAGSVVSRDLPDYAVAAGAPARVLKKFDPLTRAWQTE